MVIQSPKKRVCVIGGTGRLGSSVAISLARNEEFEPFVTSRDAQGVRAERMKAAGIHVVTANNWDEAALRSAFQDCWAVYFNIDSDNEDEKWKTGKTPTEVDMGNQIIDSATHAGVKHVVHASLSSASKISGGKVPMISLDAKAEISDYLVEVTKAGKLETCTTVIAGWFLENSFDPRYTSFFGGFALKRDADGYMTWKTPPMGNDPESVPWLAVQEDYGDIVHGILLDPQRWNQKRVQAFSESAGFAELTAIYQTVTGNKARYVALTRGKLTATGAGKTAEVNGLFDLMNSVEGKYFDGQVSDNLHARCLKDEACRTTGRPVGLTTIEEFFRNSTPSGESHTSGG